MGKKDIVVVFNGLGNQMSQYAFYLAKKHIELNTDFIFYNSEFNHNGYELDNIFGIKLHTNYKIELIFSFLMKNNIFCKTIKKILNILGFIKFYYEDTNSYDYDSKFLSKGVGVINFYVGGWHSELYFSEVRDIVKKSFNFNEDKITEKNKCLSHILRNKNCASIHIRRGDFLNPKNKKFSSIATKLYYEKAIDIVKKRNIDTFVLFSDDMKWVKENFVFSNCIYVDWNKKEESWQDMYLMTLCSININPNSTFSWWASWLNEKSDCIIVPDRFIVNHKNKDFYPEKWIKLCTDDHLQSQEAWPM